MKKILERIRNRSWWHGRTGGTTRRTREDGCPARAGKQTREEINSIKSEIEEVTMKIIEVDKEAADFMKRSSILWPRWTKLPIASSSSGKTTQGDSL